MIPRMAIDAVDALSRVPLLAGIERRHLERLARQFRERTFPEGAVVTCEGETGAGFFVIAEGSATVTIGGELRASLGTGDAFGEMALIDDGPRSATIVAATDLHCLALSPWDFRPFVEEHPSVAWAMLQTLARRLREVEAS
jgi:CRP/FNR family transcriptional regulator